jgi:hypothetical protein
MAASQKETGSQATSCGSLIDWGHSRYILVYVHNSFNHKFADPVAKPRRVFPIDLPSKHKGSSKKANICVTPECIHASSEILYNLSPQYKTLDPCSEDLEELICGGWRERHDLRPDQGDAFTGTTMAESSQMLLRHILEAPYPKESFVCCCDCHFCLY